MAYLKIETAQNVEIEHNIASVSDRIGAQLLDYFIYMIYFITIAIIEMTFEIPHFFSGYLYILFLSMPIIFYPLIMEIAYNGQTLGKMILKIKVVRLDGMPVSIGDYLLRWLFIIIDIRITTGLIAVITILINSKGQRLGDLAAGTTVVSLQNNISLQNTILSEIPENYVIQFPEVYLLDDSDIQLINDVKWHVSKNNGSPKSIKTAYKAKKALEEKMGISTDLKASKFFKTIIKDYNAYHIQNS